MAKEREKYASDADFREKKKNSNSKSYEKFKEKQNEEREKQKIENDKKDARFIYESKKKEAKDMIYLWKKKLLWFTNCIIHFLETFPETDEEVQSEMMKIEKSIKEKHEKIEKRVGEILEKVKDSEDSSEISMAFKGERIPDEYWAFKGGIEEKDLKHEYQTFEHDVRERLEKILENIGESEENKDWYYMIQTIQERSIERFPAWWREDEPKEKYFKKKDCIICKKEPNCLEKNWLTRVEYEKVTFGPNVFLARGLKEPTDDVEFYKIMKKWKY